jgi:S1-C subfamily serine protease
VLQAFTPEHLQDSQAPVRVGSSLLVVGFPLGFHNTLHHLPVVRQAVIASAFGMRFQGQGFFLTDARTHRGTSGAPVVMHDPSSHELALPWKLLGVQLGAHGHEEPRQGC